MSLIDFENGPEEEVCLWVMQIVSSVVMRVIESEGSNSSDNVIQYTAGDSNIMTFEDRYLDILMEFYNLNLISVKKAVKNDQNCKK